MLTRTIDHQGRSVSRSGIVLCCKLYRPLPCTGLACMYRTGWVGLGWDRIRQTVAVDVDVQVDVASLDCQCQWHVFSPSVGKHPAALN